MKFARILFVLTIVLLIHFFSGDASAAAPCYRGICKDYYFTGSMTGYSWSPNRKGIVRPYYASFRRENRTVVVQVDKVFNDGSFTTKSYDVNHPRLVVTSKNLLKRNEIAIENTRKFQ